MEEAVKLNADDERRCHQFQNENHNLTMRQVLAIYRDGLRAGIDRAAEMCEEASFHASLWAASVDEKGKPLFDKRDIETGTRAIDQCAADIRALLDD
jgi:hypothetical protein